MKCLEKGDNMLTFLGDIALISAHTRSEYKPDHQYVFNCEYVIGKRLEMMPVPGKINLSGIDCDFQKVFGKQPIAVTLSNNHINDFGSQGYENTVNSLKRQGIKIAVGELLWIGNICLLSYMDLDSGNRLDRNFIFKKKVAHDQIRKAKENKDARIVVLIHWGIENDPNPTKRQISNAHWLIDEGVDLIIGHHPHCVQKVEEYKGKYIFYSLGNGLFPPINQPSHYDSNGRPTRIYRFKWQKWNRKSYAVTIDDNAQVIKVETLVQTKDSVLKSTGDVDINRLILKKDYPKWVYRFRKYYLFFISNCFVDGKLFDIKAIKAEMNK